MRKYIGNADIYTVSASKEDYLVKILVKSI